MKRLTTINKDAPNEFNILALFGINFNIKNDIFSIEDIPARELLLLDGRWGVRVEYLDNAFRDPEELEHLSIYSGGVFVKDSRLEIVDEKQLHAYEAVSAYYRSVLDDLMKVHVEKLFKYLDEETLLPLDGFECKVVDLDEAGWAIRIYVGEEFVTVITGLTQSIAYCSIYGKEKVIEMNMDNLVTGKTKLPPIEAVKEE